MHGRVFSLVKNLLRIKVEKAPVVGKDRLIEVGVMAARVLAVTVVLIMATDLIMAVVQVTETARAMARDRVMAQEITVARVLIH